MTSAPVILGSPPPATGMSWLPSTGWQGEWPGGKDIFMRKISRRHKYLARFAAIYYEYDCSEYCIRSPPAMVRHERHLPPGAQGQDTLR